MLNAYANRLPLIAILRGVAPDEVVPVASALSRAGLVMMEVTLNSPAPFDSIEKLSQQFGASCLTGAGTVTAARQVQEVKKAGGRLIVSPHTDAELIRFSKAEGMIVVPGCFSPTEVFTAIQAGANGVKLFPAELVTPSAVKAMRAVLPSDLIMFAVGGISSENMAEYLRCGVDGFGIGSSLYKPGKSLDAIAADAFAIVKAFKTASDLLNARAIENQLQQT